MISGRGRGHGGLEERGREPGGDEQVREDAALYAHASRVLHKETNPHNARPLIQAHGDRELWLNSPPLPLETDELDWVFELPYTRLPHTSYGDARIPAYEMIRHSVNIMRGCFGGCTFCSITEHEGRIIQNRSEDSIIREVEQINLDRDDVYLTVVSDQSEFINQSIANVRTSAL